MKQRDLILGRCANLIFGLQPSFLSPPFAGQFFFRIALGATQLNKSVRQFRICGGRSKITL